MRNSVPRTYARCLNVDCNWSCAKLRVRRYQKLTVGFRQFLHYWTRVMCEQLIEALTTPPRRNQVEAMIRYRVQGNWKCKANRVLS